MESRFFGHWLVSRGYLSTDQLLIVLNLQLDTNKEIGQFAAEVGVCTREEVQAVEDTQRRTNRAFDQVVVEAGLLTADQAERLAQRYMGQRMYLGEVVAKLGFMPYRKVMAELDMFLKLRGDPIRPGPGAARQVKKAVDPEAFIAALTLTFKGIAHQDMRLARIEKGAIPQHEHTLWRKLDPETYVGLSMGTEEMILVANKISGGKLSTVNAMVIVAAEEMLNAIVTRGTKATDDGTKGTVEVAYGGTLPVAGEAITCFFSDAEESVELLLGFPRSGL